MWQELFCLDEKHSILCVYHNFRIHPLVNGYIGYFWFGAGTDTLLSTFKSSCGHRLSLLVVNN